MVPPGSSSHLVPPHQKTRSSEKLDEVFPRGGGLATDPVDFNVLSPVSDHQ